LFRFARARSCSAPPGFWTAIAQPAIGFSLPLLERLGAIPVAERVVIDRNRVTAAGVSAGIDCALQLAAILRGENVAKAIQLQIEYDPQPPFSCGSPSKAPGWLVEKLTEETKTVIDARLATVERIASARAAKPLIS